MRKIYILGFVLILGTGIMTFYHDRVSQAAPLAQLTPFPTPTPGRDGRIMYIVQSGDSLWRIAAVSGIPINELRALNNLGTNDVINPGQEILLGLGGPASALPTQGPPPTATSELPTPTPGIGTGTLCVLLFVDVNGDSVRQEEEVSLPNGAISVGDRFGNISLSANTPSGGISENLFPEPEEIGFTCFDDLEKGEYNITVAIPDGYNATTNLSYFVELISGEEVLLGFGAQANTETQAKAPFPEGEGLSPTLGILGGLILIVGIGLGIYTLVFSRRR